jgi:hypothetical protein
MGSVGLVTAQLLFKMRIATCPVTIALGYRRGQDIYEGSTWGVAHLIWDMGHGAGRPYHLTSLWPEIQAGLTIGCPARRNLRSGGSRPGISFVHAHSPKYSRAFRS